MWVIIHWYYLFVCEPNPIFHTVTGLLLVANDKANLEEKIEQVPSAIGMTIMYIGYYCRGHILDYGFLPWWVLTVAGIRNRGPVVLLGGITLGIYFLTLNWLQISGHVLMNTGRAIRAKRMNYRMHGIVHMVLGFTMPFIFQNETSDVVSIENIYKVSLAVMSSIILIKSKDNMDWFSLCSIFSSPTTLPLALLHLISLDWYECFRNNHFKIVKGSCNWIIPLFLFVYPFYAQITVGISASKIV